MIGYLGAERSYTYFAATSITEKNNLISYNNIGRLFYALEHDEVVGIIVPFENMKEGTSFDVLGRVRKAHYHINKEIVHDIILSVVSVENNPRDIMQVFATELSINEGYNTLKSELGKIQRIEVKTDKIALDKLNENTDIKRGAVISNFEEFSNLNVVASNIRDTGENTHKYVLINKSLNVKGFHNRTMIACTPKANRVGALYDILHEFVLRGINIIKILSQPTRNKEDDILLYIELEGNIESDNMTEALGLVRYKSRTVSILGSYSSE